MKSFVNIINGLCFFIIILLGLFLIFGWLFSLDIKNILIALRYVGFVFLVSWFINLLFFKK